MLDANQNFEELRSAFNPELDASSLRANAARRGRSVSVIPSANRYPRSAVRAELEASLQPWNRARLGSSLWGPPSA